jgi:hypothetical protein
MNNDDDDATHFQPAILRDFELAGELQRIYKALKEYTGTDPDVLKARKKLEIARLCDQGKAIENAHFGKISEGDRAEGRFMI